jgi:hypothetical protein
MAFARVVSFEGVSGDSVAQVKSQIENDPRPEDIPATEILMLHDADAERSLVIMLFETEEDYRLGDATLNAMTPGDTPGRRASVDKFEVALRRMA